MTSAARSALLALGLLLVGCAHPLVVDRVVVRDAQAQFQAVRTLRDPVALERFEELWLARRRVDLEPLTVRDFGFSLDITASEGSSVWMYRPDGLTMMLSQKEDDELYAIQDPAEFNALLGIGGDEESGDRAD